MSEKAKINLPGERKIKKVEMEGTKRVAKEVLVGHRDGSNDIVMRKFIVQKEGHTPFHKHDFEHLVYILEGNGLLKLENKEIPLSKGASVFVPRNILHQFINTGEEDFIFICVVPGHGDKD